MAGASNVILGLGETGLSYARYLAARGESFSVLDDAASPRRLEALKLIDSAAVIKPISSEALAGATCIYVSPGVPLALPELQGLSSDVVLRGDIQMFGELATAPIVAITGTNGKSTVAQLVFELASAQQDHVVLAGNIGTPCLDVLDEAASLYVLEVSSYQLELATNLSPRVATVLNLSQDHLDRYESEDDYFRTKLTLYDDCDMAVINRDVAYKIPEGVRTIGFGIDAASGKDEFGINVAGDITFAGDVLVRADDLKISGRHNLLNVEAALAIGYLLELDLAGMVNTLRSFTGLPHRSEFVAEIDGVRYINDSKATNPGAMIAAVVGESSGRNIHLIAGGDGKDADFSHLGELVADHVKQVYLIGDAAGELQSSLQTVPSARCASLDQAVTAAKTNAGRGDVVLLSPGCASFDQFRDYKHRGDVFRSLVQEQTS